MKYIFILILLGSLSIIAENNIFDLTSKLDHLKNSFDSLSKSLEKPIETQEKLLNTYLQQLKELTEDRTLNEYLREATLALQKLILQVPDVLEESTEPADLVKHINNLAKLKYFDLIARIGMIFSTYPTSKEQKENFIQILRDLFNKTKDLAGNIQYLKINKEDIYNKIYSSDVSYIENLKLIISALNLALNNTESLQKTYDETTESLNKVAKEIKPETDAFSKLNNSLPILNLFVFYVPDTNRLETWQQSLETINEKFEKDPSLKSNESVKHFIKNSQTAINNIKKQLENLKNK